MPAKFINDRSQLLNLSYSQLENKDNPPEKVHEGHTYVKIGKIKTNSSAWERVAYAIKGIATLAFACLLLPLLFSSFRSSLSHTWSQFWNSSKNTSIYLKENLLHTTENSGSSQINGLNNVSREVPLSPLSSLSIKSTIDLPVTDVSSPHATTLIQKAKKLKKQGRYFETAIFYQKCLEIDPKNAPLRVEYAEVLKKQGEEHTKELRKLYEEGLKLLPNDMTVLFNYAKFNIKDHEAERDYKKALEKNPDNAGVRVTYAKLLIKRYEDTKSDLLDGGESIKEEVLDLYKTGLQREPKHPLLLLKYAKFLLKHLNQIEEAIDCYQNAQIDSSNIDFHVSYANILPGYLQEMAQEIYQRCLDQQPSNALLLLSYAKFLRDCVQDINVDEILFYGERALAISPNSVEVYIRYGNLLSSIDPVKSLSVLEKGLNLQPCDQTLLKNYENVCQRLNHPEKAAERYQRAFEIDSDNNNFFFKFIKFIDENQRLVLIEKLVQRQPENPPILSLYGGFLIGKSRQSTAINEKMQNLGLSQLKNALKLASTNLDVVLFYAEILQQIERYEEAAEQCQRIIDLDLSLTDIMRAKYFEILKKLNQKSKIEVYYQRFLKNHSDLSLHEEYIKWLICQNRRQDALNELEKTLNYQMQYDKYIHLLTDILSNRGKIAQEEFNETCKNYLLGKIAEQPQNIILKWFLARFLEEKNQFDKAVEEYKEILKLHPHLSKIQAKYVELLEKKESWDDLEVYAESLDQNHPQDACMIVQIINIFKDEDEFERVIRLYEKTLLILSNAQLNDYENFLHRIHDDRTTLEALHEFKCKKYPTIENLESYGCFLIDRQPEERIAEIYLRLLRTNAESMQSKSLQKNYFSVLEKLNQQDKIQKFFEVLCQTYPTIDNLEHYINYLTVQPNFDERKVTQLQNKLLDCYKEKLSDSSARKNYSKYSQIRQNYFSLLVRTGRQTQLYNYFENENRYYERKSTIQPQLLKDYGLMLADWSSHVKEEKKLSLIQKSVDLLAKALKKADAQLYLDLKNTFPEQLLKLNQLDKIENFYRKGLALNPHSIPMRSRYAKHLKDNQNFERALTEFLLIIEKVKASRNVWDISIYYLEAAHTLEQLNRIEEAASYYKKYGELSLYHKDRKYQEFKKQKSDLLANAADLP
ncbi:Uncharacterized protein PRO82_000584 [Candidatus Protochlamydia amoebophila]|uniref:tetratricopeptide repeat protein n=1 Tax=Candidatus Protochlamydia amoebophila TaxID=362787 RepID=UPI001BC9C528|nr:tetratricopeptide repeat protein [Candidatus Protochlamydia amoebophila]MBS4163284.1 Uncharacterized protein [Candidatus Protochlamydia amoebophila]